VVAANAMKANLATLRGLPTARTGTHAIDPTTSPALYIDSNNPATATVSSCSRVSTGISGVTAA
jgi:hypothetical protein